MPDHSIQTGTDRNLSLDRMPPRVTFPVTFPLYPGTLEKDSVESFPTKILSIL